MMDAPVLMARAWYAVCLASGRLLRSAKYARTRITRQEGQSLVRKRRMRFAPGLVWVGGGLMKLLGTGVRVLPQREWERREQALFMTLHRASIRVEAGGTLVLPCLEGATLASLLENTRLMDADRTRAIELATVALREFHHRGLTHADAMAENVMVDLQRGAAHWFDFETEHEAARPVAWRRADDVRALLATCLLRSTPQAVPGTLHFILRVYGDEGATQLLAERFDSASQRPLMFHLGQAPLPYRRFCEIGRLLRERVADSSDVSRVRRR